MFNYRKDKVSVSIIYLNIIVIRGEGKNSNKGYTVRTNDLENINKEIEMFRNMTLDEVTDYLTSEKIKYDKVEFT